MAIRSAATRSAIRNGITNRVPFKAPATLSGAWEDGSLYLGRMSSGEQSRIREETSEAPRVYVVRSYTTPVAWYVEGRGWSVTTDKHSVTTGGHVSAIHQVIG